MKADTFNIPESAVNHKEEMVPPSINIDFTHLMNKFLVTFSQVVINSSPEENIFIGLSDSLDEDDGSFEGRYYLILVIFTWLISLRTFLIWLFR